MSNQSKNSPKQTTGPKPPEHSHSPTNGPSFDVFISHSAADRPAAKAIAERLSRLGSSVFLDDVSIRVGADWSQSTREAIERSKACVVLLSSKSRPSDPFVSREWATIQERSWRHSDFPVYAVKLDDVETPPFLRKWQTIDLHAHAPGEAEFNRAVSRLCNRVAHGAPASKSAPSSSDQSATEERFSEILRALTRAEGVAEGRVDDSRDG